MKNPLWLFDIILKCIVFFMMMWLMEAFGDSTLFMVLVSLFVASTAYVKGTRK